MITFPIITREDVRRTCKLLLKDDALWFLLSETSTTPWEQGWRNHYVYNQDRKEIIRFEQDCYYLNEVVCLAPIMYGLLLTLLRTGWTPCVQNCVLDFFTILNDLELKPWFAVNNPGKLSHEIYEQEEDGEDIKIGEIPYENVSPEDMTLILMTPFLVGIFQQLISKIDEYTLGIKQGLLEPNYGYIRRELLSRIWHPDLRILPDYL